MITTFPLLLGEFLEYPPNIKECVKKCVTFLFPKSLFQLRVVNNDVINKYHRNKAPR